MKINLLKEKIERIRRSSPTIEDFTQKGFDNEYSTQIANDFKLEFRNEVTNENDELFKLFNSNVNFKNFSVFGLQFVPYKEYEDFFHIGSMEADHIILIKATQELAVLDYLNSEILYFISENFDNFLDLLPILIDYDKIGYLGDKYTNEIKTETLQKIKDVLKDKKYYSFFEQRLI